MTGPYSSVPVDSRDGSGATSASVPGYPSGPHLRSGHNVAPHPNTGAWAQAPQAAPPSTLHKWSLVLALVALLAAVGTGVMVWQSNQQRAPEPSPPVEIVAPPVEATVPTATPATAPATPPPTQPGPATEPEIPPEPMTAPTAEPTPKAAGRRKSKRRDKKRTAPEPAPSPVPEEPTSKKPSPTDTLLPIRE